MGRPQSVSVATPGSYYTGIRQPFYTPCVIHRALQGPVP